MTSPNASMPTIAPSGRSYSPSEWERMQGVIARVYRDDQKTLKDLRTILARQYGFHPTLAMLKKRIHKWDLDKKHKEPDMLVALQIALAREAQGKKTTFVVRNRDVTLEEIKQYFKRKGIRDPRALLTGTQVCTSTTSLECYTPPPSPGAEAISASPNWEDFDEMDLDIGELSEDGGVYRLVIHGASEQSVPSSAQRVYSSLPLAEDQGRLESLLMFTRVCNEVDVQNRDMRRFPYSLCHQVFDLEIAKGRTFLNVGRFQEAFVFFNKAFDMVHEILKSDLWPALLLEIYELTMVFADEENTEILHRLFDFVVQLSGVYVERVRPLKQAMTVLIQIPSKERADSVARGMDYLCENPIGASVLSRYADTRYGVAYTYNRMYTRMLEPRIAKWRRWRNFGSEEKASNFQSFL